MYKVYGESKVFSFSIIIEKNEAEYFKIEKGAIVQLDKNKINIKKLIALDFYHFNEQSLNILEEYFEEREYFEKLTYQKVFFLYDKVEKEVLFYNHNRRYVLATDGRIVSKKEDLTKEAFVNLLKQELSNRNVIYKGLELKDVESNLKNVINYNVKEYLNELTNEKLVSDFIDSSEINESNKEDAYEIDGSFVVFEEYALNLLEIKHMSYKNEHIKFHTYKTSDYFHINSTKEDFKAIRKVFIKLHNENKKEKNTF